MTQPDEDKAPRNVATTSETAAADARAQADAYESLFGNTDLELDGGETISIPPHPDYGMLDDDRMEAYEEYSFEIDTEFDREDDIFIPEQIIRDDNGHEIGRLPSSTQRGALKRPYRKDGVLVKPPHSIRVVQIALGEVDWKRLKEGGKSSKDVWAIWGKQAAKIAERRAEDSKSARSSVDMAAVPTTNS
jgi:hypothetical protein